VYDLLLTVHVLAAAAWLGGSLMLLLIGYAMKRRERLIEQGGMADPGVATSLNRC
jgi:putative copper export protein